MFHGFFSQRALEMFGGYRFRDSHGQIVMVTRLYPSLEAGQHGYAWEDAQYVGEVDETKPLGPIPGRFQHPTYDVYLAAEGHRNHQRKRNRIGDTAITPEDLSQSGLRILPLRILWKRSFEEIYLFVLPSLAEPDSGKGDLLEIWDWRDDLSAVRTSQGFIPTVPDTKIFVRE